VGDKFRLRLACGVIPRFSLVCIGGGKLVEQLEDGVLVCERCGRTYSTTEVAAYLRRVRDDLNSLMEALEV